MHNVLTVQNSGHLQVSIRSRSITMKAFYKGTQNVSPNHSTFLFCLQQSPKLLSPGSGNVSARYVGWNAGMAHGVSNIQRFNKYEDSDSGNSGSSSEAHVIKHIDRNILACQICLQRYKEPKVSQFP